MNALVIGGGIGGLATALALRRVGITADVFEQAPEIREIGAGLSVWCNGLEALRWLGADEAVREAGSPLRLLENADWLGNRLNVIPIHVFGHHVAIERADLLETLRRKLDPTCLHTGKRLVDLVQENGSVRATFGDGSTARGEVLIGADGIHSTVRAVLDPTAVPRDAGQTVWRGIASFSHERWPIGTALSYMGRGKHFATEPLRDGRIFWYAVVNRPRGEDSGRRIAPRVELGRLFEDAPPPVPELIEKTDEAWIIRNLLLDLPTPRRWVHGRVALIGDAAHAMRPNLGQGACLALEDAVVLARALAQALDPARALRKYARLRRRRVRWVVFWSRQISRLEQTQGRVSCALRDFWLRWLSPGPVNLPWFWTICRFRAS